MWRLLDGCQFPLNISEICYIEPKGETCILHMSNGHPLPVSISAKKVLACVGGEGILDHLEKDEKPVS